jgi:hypothetical protein
MVLAAMLRVGGVRSEDMLLVLGGGGGFSFPTLRAAAMGVQIPLTAKGVSMDMWMSDAALRMLESEGLSPVRCMTWFLLDDGDPAGLLVERSWLTPARLTDRILAYQRFFQMLVIFLLHCYSLTLAEATQAMLRERLQGGKGVVIVRVTNEVSTGGGWDWRRYAARRLLVSIDGGERVSLGSAAAQALARRMVRTDESLGVWLADFESAGERAYRGSHVSVGAVDLSMKASDCFGRPGEGVADLLADNDYDALDTGADPAERDVSEWALQAVGSGRGGQDRRVSGGEVLGRLRELVREVAGNVPLMSPEDALRTSQGLCGGRYAGLREA